jgi:hypothetical protein
VKNGITKLCLKFVGDVCDIRLCGLDAVHTRTKAQSFGPDWHGEDVPFHKTIPETVLMIECGLFFCAATTTTSG